jgi:hypothetical protein
VERILQGRHRQDGRRRSDGRVHALDHRGQRRIGLQAGHAGEAPPQEAEAAPIGLHPCPRPVGKVGAGPGAGHGRQVVGGDAGHGLARPAPWRPRLEQGEARGQHVGRGEPTPDARRHGAQVLADDHGSRPLGLDGQHRQQLVGGLAHVRAVARVRASRHPPLPEQPQHVVDPKAAAMRHGRPDRVDERPVAGQPQPGGHERRQSPVLAGRIEDVRRCAEARRSEHRLPHPRVEAAGVEADGQVVDEPQLATGRRHLTVEQPLHPGMKGDPLRQAASLAPHPDALRIAQLVRPRAPARPMLLAQRGIQAPSPEIGARGSRRFIQRRAPCRRCPPQSLERRQLEPANLGADDRGRAVQGPAGARQRRQLGGQEPVTRDVLDGQVERVPEATRARVVGARLGIRRRVGGAERADQQRARAHLGRPRGQPPQVGQVAHPPARARACGVQLNGPAPGAPATWQRAARRRDQQQLFLGAAAKTVVAVWHVARQDAHRAELASILQHQFATRWQSIPGTHDAHQAGRALRIASLQPHRLQHRPPRRRLCHPSPAPGVGPGLLDRARPGHSVRGSRKRATDRPTRR